MNIEYKVTMLKLASTHNGLGADLVEGFCWGLPKPGRSFVMIGRAPDQHHKRISTSLVLAAEDDQISKVRFQTMNSEYLLEYKCDQ